jgi:hypothetical protein
MEPPNADGRSETTAPVSRASHHSINGTIAMLHSTPTKSKVRHSRRVSARTGSAPLCRRPTSSQQMRNPRAASNIASSAAMPAAIPRDA